MMLPGQPPRKSLSTTQRGPVLPSRSSITSRNSMRPTSRSRGWRTSGPTTRLMATSSSKTKPSISPQGCGRPSAFPAAAASVRPSPVPIRSTPGWVFLFSVFRPLPASLCTLLLAAAAVLTTPAAAQEQENPYEIEKIVFEGNAAFDDGRLREVISSKETAGGFSKFLFHTFGEKLGSGPEYFDEATF